MSRSLWKGNFIDKGLYKYFSKKKNESIFKSPIKSNKFENIDKNQKITKNNKENKLGKSVQVKKNSKNSFPLIRIRSRRSTILKPFVDKEVWIYNGKNYLKKKITENMVGHKFGEFAYTRKKFFFKKSKK